MSSTPQLDDAGLGSLLATRLRERRHEVGRKLSEVAAAAEVSASYLSAIEKGTSVPSLPVLARLAHALDLSLADVLRSSASSQVARGRIVGALGSAALAAPGSRLQIVRTASRPGATGSAPLELGGTDAFVFVVSGRLDVDVDGSTFELEPGAGLHCDLPKRITWHVSGDERAIALWTASSQTRRVGT